MKIIDLKKLNYDKRDIEKIVKEKYINFNNITIHQLENNIIQHTM